MTVHLYKCKDCAVEVEVPIKLGESSETPLHPQPHTEDGKEHKMQRKFIIAGGFVRW